VDGEAKSEAARKAVGVSVAADAVEVEFAGAGAGQFEGDAPDGEFAVEGTSEVSGFCPHIPVGAKELGRLYQVNPRGLGVTKSAGHSLTVE